MFRCSRPSRSGALFGWLAPHVASADWVKALGDGFVKLIKMAIAPIIFCTVVSGVAHIEDAKKVGRVGVKALVYFEIVSTFALASACSSAICCKPGARFRRQGRTPAAIAKYTEAAAQRSGVEFLLDIIPDSAFGAFAKGDILQVLLFSMLFGFALHGAGRAGPGDARSSSTTPATPCSALIDIVMKAAPIGAFGAMAYTVGKYGSAALLSLGGLIGAFYLTSALFVVVVLGADRARRSASTSSAFSPIIKDELLIVLGTSSSESALPR